MSDLAELIERVEKLPEIGGDIISDDRLVEIIQTKAFKYPEAFDFPATFVALLRRYRALIASRPKP